MFSHEWRALPEQLCTRILAHATEVRCEFKPNKAGSTHEQPRRSNHTTTAQFKSCEINELQQNQRFDVTALVEQVSEPCATQKDRVRRQIQIIDQSRLDSKVLEIKWTFFSNKKTSETDSATIDILRQSAKTTEPLSFFGLTGKKWEQGFSIGNSKDFFVVKATGEKATKLSEIAQKLHDTPTQEREVLQQAIGSGRNYKDDKGRETFCTMLNSMARPTNVPSIDEDNTLWQLNWAEIAWPEGSESDLCTQDGSRLFFLTDVRDGTGLNL